MDDEIMTSLSLDILGLIELLSKTKGTRKKLLLLTKLEEKTEQLKARLEYLKTLH